MNTRTHEARQIPVSATQIRHVFYRFRPLVNANSTLQWADELAVREAHWLSHRADPKLLKRGIRKTLGFKAMSLS